MNGIVGLNLVNSKKRVSCLTLKAGVISTSFDIGDAIAQATNNAMIAIFIFCSINKLN